MIRWKRTGENHGLDDTIFALANDGLVHLFGFCDRSGHATLGHRDLKPSHDIHGHLWYTVQKSYQQAYPGQYHPDIHNGPLFCGCYSHIRVHLATSFHLTKAAPGAGFFAPQFLNLTARFAASFSRPITTRIVQL